MMQGQRDMGKQAFDSPALMAVVEMERDKIEAQCMADELERLAGVSGAGRRGSKHGGGEVAKKAFNWLWGKISEKAVAAGAASDTAAALTEVLNAAKMVPSESVKGVDAAIAASIRKTVPVIKGLAAAAPPAAAFVGMSYMYSHPSISVGIADYATRLAALTVDKVGGFGPSWANMLGEIDVSLKIAKGAAINAATVAANRPYLAATIAWVLLDQYAKSKGKTASGLLKETGNAIASKALGLASGAAASAADFGKDFADVAVYQWNDFIIWLEKRPELGAEDAKKQLGELKTKFGDAIRERAEAAAAIAKEEEKKASAKAPPSPGPKGEDAAEEGMAQYGKGRRLTSRRRRLSLPRRTRRSSSGRSRGSTRRR
jgi:hypothetical protein